MVLAVSAMYAKEEEKAKGRETVTFQVEGMDCNNCVKKVEKNIAFEKGVTDLTCDLETRTATVTFKSDKTDSDKIASAFKKIGMEAVAVDEDKQDLGHTH